MSTIILNTPDQIRFARLASIRSGLKLEIKTGLRHSRNMVLRAAQAETGKKTRTACLAAIEKLIEKMQNENLQNPN